MQEPCPGHLHCFLFAILFVRGLFWDFPGSAVAETSPPKAGGAGSIPVQAAPIPHVLQPKYQSIKQKQYCHKFNKNLNNGSHKKIL